MSEQPTCPLCGKSTDSLHHEIEQQLLATIRQHNPHWVAEDGSCLPCLEHYGKLSGEGPIV